MLINCVLWRRSFETPIIRLHAKRVLCVCLNRLNYSNKITSLPFFHLTYKITNILENWIDTFVIHFRSIYKLNFALFDPVFFFRNFSARFYDCYTDFFTNGTQAPLMCVVHPSYSNTISYMVSTDDVLRIHWLWPIYRPADIDIGRDLSIVSDFCFYLKKWISCLSYKIWNSQNVGHLDTVNISVTWEKKNNFQ